MALTLWPLRNHRKLIHAADICRAMKYGTMNETAATTSTIRIPKRILTQMLRYFDAIGPPERFA